MGGTAKKAWSVAMSLVMALSMVSATALQAFADEAGAALNEAQGLVYDSVYGTVNGYSLMEKTYTVSEDIYNGEKDPVEFKVNQIDVVDKDGKVTFSSISGGRGYSGNSEYTIGDGGYLFAHSDGFVEVRNSESLCGVIDLDGRMIVSAQYNDLFYDANQGLFVGWRYVDAGVSIDLIDRSGSVIASESCSSDSQGSTYVYAEEYAAGYFKIRYNRQDTYYRYSSNGFELIPNVSKIESEGDTSVVISTDGALTIAKESAESDIVLSAADLGLGKIDSASFLEEGAVIRVVGKNDDSYVSVFLDSNGKKLFGDTASTGGSLLSSNRLYKDGTIYDEAGKVVASLPATIVDDESYQIIYGGGGYLYASNNTILQKYDSDGKLIASMDMTALMAEMKLKAAAGDVPFTVIDNDGSSSLQGGDFSFDGDMKLWYVDDEYFGNVQLTFKFTNESTGWSSMKVWLNSSFSEIAYSSEYVSFGPVIDTGELGANALKFQGSVVDSNFGTISVGEYSLGWPSESTNSYAHYRSTACRSDLGMYYVYDDAGHCGITDKNGTVILPVEYDDMFDMGKADSPYALFKKDGAWNIVDLKALLDMSSAQVTCSDVTYEGDPAPVPSYTASIKGKELTEGVDYKVSNISYDFEKGTGSLDLEGIGLYSGVISVSFKVNVIKKDPIDISTASITASDVTYDGKSAVVPALTVKDGDKALVEGTDYKVSSIEYDLSAGTGEAVVEGVGAYTGKVVAAFAVTTPDELRFPDVAQPEWYFESCAFAKANGLISGYENGDFGPADTLTRAQAAAILQRYFAPAEADAYVASDAANATGMADVADGQWYTGAANWAVREGVINGVKQGDGSRLFDPYGVITREQLCAIVGNAAAKWCGAIVEGADRAKLYGLLGADMVSDWAVDSVAWGVNAGVINGVATEAGRDVAASASVERSVMAAVMMNAIQNNVIRR